MKSFFKVLVLGLAFVAAGSAVFGAATRSSKIQLVYRGEDGGPWRMYIFGAECSSPDKVRVVESSDPTQPLELECSSK